MWYKWETCLYCESIMELKIVLKGFFSTVYERKISVDILHVPKFSFLTNICFFVTDFMQVQKLTSGAVV